jgi:hypothetical protein
MTNTQQSEAERARRTEFIRNSKAANQQRQTLEQRTKRREDAADEWAAWLHHKMGSAGCVSPTELLPDILAKMEQTIDDRVAAAISEIKTKLRKALS